MCRCWLANRDKERMERQRTLGKWISPDPDAHRHVASTQLRDTLLSNGTERVARANHLTCSQRRRARSRTVSAPGNLPSRAQGSSLVREEVSTISRNGATRSSPAALGFARQVYAQRDLGGIRSTGRLAAALDPSISSRRARGHCTAATARGGDGQKASRCQRSIRIQQK
jgi:hypothetical protein